jgi:hypothetical protein
MSRKAKILKRLERAEKMISKGNSELNDLANEIQHLFDEEISVCWSQDGALVTNDNGEIGFL